MRAGEENENMASISELKERLQYVFWACAGAVVIGVTLPTVLTCWNCGERGIFGDHEAAALSAMQLAEDWFGLQVAATLFCGPGAVILALLLFFPCRRLAKKAGATLRNVAWCGVLVGTVMGFLNLPGWAVGFILPASGRHPVEIRVLLLFLISGASCGAWIAWQAWRAEHPGERFFPRYSLMTLILFVFAWGLLLAIFAPK
ncbi:MAG TPA: hypothetical protein VGP72_22145 [Planctomycetota bacterium]|jgi:hypothetical protein